MLRFQVDLKLGVTLFNPVHWVKSISLSERRKQRNKESTKLAVRGGDPGWTPFPRAEARTLSDIARTEMLPYSKGFSEHDFGFIFKHIHPKHPLPIISALYSFLIFEPFFPLFCEFLIHSFLTPSPKMRAEKTTLQLSAIACDKT